MQPGRCKVRSRMGYRVKAGNPEVSASNGYPAVTGKWNVRPLMDYPMRKGNPIVSGAGAPGRVTQKCT